MNAGRISKSNSSVILTTNYLKQVFGLDLTPEERNFEKKFMGE